MNKEHFDFPFNDEPFDERGAIKFENDTDSYLDEFLESLRL